MEKQVVKKRDIKGKFALKNKEYRLVRSLRLTDSTWEKLGTAAQLSGMTRADWLEELIRKDEQLKPSNTRLEEAVTQPDTADKGCQEKAQPFKELAFSLENLEILCTQVLTDLKLGKQATGFKSAQKVLKQLLIVAHRSRTSLY